ncbi:hypothetical protein [Dactylosporangium sp. CA-139066]
MMASKSGRDHHGAFGRGCNALDAATRRTSTVNRAIVAGWD